MFGIDYNEIGFLLLATLFVAIATNLSGRAHGNLGRKLILWAVLLRVVGSVVRYEMIFRFYDGLGDAVRYYREGLALADGIWGLTINPFTLDYWAPDAARWGTAFVIQISGLVLTLTGPTMRGEFLVFAMMSLLGLAFIGLALRNYHDARQTARLMAPLVLWPSIWFWPASTGKESIAMLAIGLVAYGYTGRRERILWLPFLTGLGLAFMIRPHVATVLAFSVLCAIWLGALNKLTVRRILEGIGGLAMAGVVFVGMQAKYGLMSADLEGFLEFVQWHMGQTLQGGSNIGAVALSPLAVPAVLMNVWMRPFPWEAHNATALISAIEVSAFWYLVYRNRQGLRALWHNWRKHRLLRFSLPLLVSYSLMIGFTFGNLGLIARQRAPMFAFMLLILVSFPNLASEHAPRKPAREPRARGLPRTAVANATDQ